MKQVLKDFSLDILRQVFGWTKPREGKIILTRYALQRMHEYDLDIDTLENVFRHGQGNSYKIVQRFSTYTVGLYYKTVKSKGENFDNRYVITTCWKRKRYYRY